MKIKNISGQDRIVPGLGDRLVSAGQVVDVDAEELWGYTQQTQVWEPADAASRKAHAKADAASRKAHAKAAPDEQPDDEQPDDEQPPAATPTDSQEG